MNIENFLKKFTVDDIILASILAVIAAILVAIFWGTIKKFLGLTPKKRTESVEAAKIAETIKLGKERLADEYEQNYRNWLIEKYRFLNVRGIKQNASVSIELEQVFISLRTKKPGERKRVPETEAELKELEDKMDYPKEFGREEWLRRKKEEYETEKIYELKELLNLSQKRFIIIGAPGSGKTTLLNYFALKFARRDVNESFRIEEEYLPIFINLRDTSIEGFLDLRRFTENYNSYIEYPHEPPVDFFKNKLNEGKCIILLDGLDEVASVEQRVKVANWVDELATAYSKNIFIATSRPYGYESARIYNDFLELHILDFTPEQVKDFVEYWTKAVEIKARGDESDFTLNEAEKRADDLLKAIKDNPKIEVLTVNPLLLTIVSLVHRYRAALPKRRVELYEECCDVLLGYWDTAKGIAEELQPRQKRTVLQPLAFYLHQNGLRDEKREKFIELLENELPKIRVSREKANDFLNNVKERCGVFVETKIDYFGFTHLTFQEFLTARHIFDNNLESFLINQRRDKYWLEVTLLYCGMKDTTSLLNKILDEKEDIFYTNLFLAGRCLAESLSVTPEIRNKITQELFDIFRDENEFEIIRETSAEILREIKDQRIIQELIEETRAEESDVRWRAADALGQMQIKAESAVLPLIELLKDKESYVRGRAADALGQIKAESAVLPLIELLKDKESDVRGRAADALGQIKAESAVLPLIELLKTKESYVRWRAADTLGQIKAESAVLPLIELLKAKESYVRGRAADALGQIKAESAVLPLIELLKDKESYVRGSAADALGQIKAESAVLPLIELLKTKESDVRWRAADALGQIKAESAVLPLIELLKTKESDVRGRAADALGLIDGKKAVESLKLLLNDSVFDVRESAFRALKEISERTNTPIYKD